MVEKRVDEEFIARHFQAKLATDEGKPGPQFQQEAGDVADEGIFDVALVGLIAKAQEVEVVGILEDLGGEPGLGRGETRRCSKLVMAAPWRRWSWFLIWMVRVSRGQDC
jgi:hypothetical protein